MRILRRYFIREFFKYFLITLTGFTAISIVAEFFDKAPEFYSRKPPASLIVSYLLLQTPQVILYILPFASLFSVLITIGIASKWRETVIVKASGTSLRRLFSSFLVLGLLLSIAALVLGETVVPTLERRAAYVRKVDILGEPPSVMNHEGTLWIKGTDGSLIRIDGIFDDPNRIFNTTILMFDKSFRLFRRIEAQEARWAEGKWTLKGVTVFDFSTGTRQQHDTYVSSSLEEPKIFREEMKKPREMSFTELRSYYGRLEKAGFKNLKYLVRLYEKLSYPAINFVMILFGVGLALKSPLGGGMRSAGLGVLISVLYWMLYSISISLGNAGTLKPWLAPWVSPLIFGFAGLILYSRIRD